MKKISDLIRTNIALAALCIISIGILIIVVQRHNKGNVSTDASVQPVIVPSGQQAPQAKLSMNSDLPAPSIFQSFVYEIGKTLSVSGTCADKYEVLMIFASSTDYRTSPLFAKYNTAEPCTMGQPYSVKVSLDSLKLEPGAGYYYIRASEGETGSWHDPY